MTICSLYVVFGDEAEALSIARAMVEERLAACANVLGACTSIFHWDGALSEAAEVAAIFKTTRARADALATRIGELHSYDVPAIVLWPAESIAGDYGEWLENAVR